MAAPQPRRSGSRSSSVTRGAALLRISLPVLVDRRSDVRGHLEPEPRRELAGPHHPDGVLAEADLGVADRPDEVPFEVLDAADVVDHGEGRDVVEEAVDREVAPDGVLGGRAEGVVGADQEIRVARLARLDLLRLRPRRNVETSTIFPPSKRTWASRKRRPMTRQFRKSRRTSCGTGVGPDVEVLRGPPRQEVADGAADEVRLVPGPVEAVENLQGVGVDVAARDGVLGAGDDPGLGHPFRWVLESIAPF